MARVVNLMEAGVKMPGRMALAEGTDHRRVIAQDLELARQTLFVEGIAKIAHGSLNLGLCGRTAMTDDAGLDAKTAGVKGGA